MFKLQRLEITGFKSFADYTEIVFTESGITAVVGPNGCGKSNLNDAMSWVLGEQKAKSLRGEEMKDVIFQGASNRRASGMAEVVLHLVRDDKDLIYEDDDLDDIDAAIGEIDENAVEISAVEASENAEADELKDDAAEMETANAAPVGAARAVRISKAKRRWKPRSFALEFMPGEAVSVTRRLYLSGESEYQLNGKTCRLRDIQDLFAGTGLSGAHYAIIEQGRIGQILSAKPAERRNLIEEAAGISKFRTRQRATEARLESAKGNLQRISDIVSEIEKQANSLRRQAAKTRRYKILRGEFRELTRQLFAAEGKELSLLLDELDEKLTGAAKTEKEIFASVGAGEEAFRAATATAREAEENLTEMRRRHSENALTRDRNSREKQYQQEQIENLNQRRAVLQGETESVKQRRELLTAEHKRLKAEESKESGAAEKTELALRQADNDYRAKLAAAAEIETAIEAERAELLRHTAAGERFAEIERQLENTTDRLHERAEGLKREGERAAETRREHQKEAAELEKILLAEREKSVDLQTEKENLRQTLDEKRAVFQAADKDLKTSRDEFARKQNRFETLRELDEKRAVYAPSVQKLFAEQAKIGVKFSGTLADYLNVDEAAEKAVENLFGNFLQAVVVESETAALKTIEFLNANNLGRIAVLVQSPKSKIQSPKAETNPNSKIRIQKSEIQSFLGINDSFAETLNEVFPREMAAQLVADLAKVKNGAAVDFDGNARFGGKLYIGGSANASEKNSSLLAFKRELRELGAATKKLTGEIEKAEKSTEKARLALAEKEENLVDLQSLIVKVERDLLAREIQTKQLAQEIERAERHERVVAEETGQIEAEIGEIRRRQKDARTNAEKAEKARRAAAEKSDAVARKLAEARAILEKANQDLNERKTLAATNAERRRAAINALRRVENEQTELENRLARQDLETAAITAKIEELNEQSAALEKRIAEAAIEKTAEQTEINAAETALKNSRENADALSAKLAGLNKNAAEARNERAALEIRQTETMTRLRSLNENAARDLNLSLVELIETEEIAADFDFAAARGKTADLRDKLDNFGAINMLALEELADVEERFLFLSTQRQDIVDGIAAAEEALREIKRRSREKFREAFQIINHNFIEFFGELFGGGHGEMTLLEADDVLEAGIEIVAQPPGKRLQNILLLSGGEKAMTAIALIMAIFKYRPAPFCLLDEVDAPLDEANVGRFVNQIAQMSEKTQFIVITHNKRTMEAARALYGVTMQEAGVSKVVSVKFE